MSTHRSVALTTEDPRVPEGLIQSAPTASTAVSGAPLQTSGSAGEPLLTVSDLRVRFTRGGRRIDAVNGLTYSLAAGRMMAIIGESGSGKSVSSRALMGLLPSTAQVSGSVRFDGTELVGMSERDMRRLRGGDIAMVFQDPARSLNPTMKIGVQITEAIRAHSDLDRKAARIRAVELLQLVRLPAPERRFSEYPHQLSGGMRQRVMIAIALAGEPRLLIADEATTALDVTTQAQIMELLVELQERLGMAIIMISHDLGLAASYAQDVAVLYAGRAVEYASAGELFGHVRMPYTRALLDAIPMLERVPHELLPVTPGQPPDLSALPPGCPFRPRCANATDTCVEHPDFLEHRPGHWWACWHPVAETAARTSTDGALR
jgi:oligopeptide/dipeptide ABC transporter ATP-binding protein